MFFGLREIFEYFQCNQCGCLQIKNIPENLYKYYPENYYSLSNQNTQVKSTIKAYFRKQVAKCYIKEWKIISYLFSKYFHNLHYCYFLNKYGVSYKSKILDVGSGIGKQLLDMESDGFKDLTGIDPYIEDDIFYDNGVNILKKCIEEMPGMYDFVMFNHSFEHMANPFEIIFHLKRILKPKSYAAISIPVVNSYAWEKYGVNWVQLDAPRHLHLHTDESMKILSKYAGLEIVDVFYNSYEFQFWGSEQYVNGISLMDENSYAVNPSKSIFSKKQIRKYRLLSRYLNSIQKGDSAIIYLKRP